MIPKVEYYVYIGFIALYVGFGSARAAIAIVDWTIQWLFRNNRPQGETSKILMIQSPYPLSRLARLHAILHVEMAIFTGPGTPASLSWEKRSTLINLSIRQERIHHRTSQQGLHNCGASRACFGLWEDNAMHRAGSQARFGFSALLCFAIHSSGR